MNAVKGHVQRLRALATAHRKKLAFSAAIFLVSVFSFAMGYIANREVSRSPIIIEKCSQVPGQQPPSAAD